MRSVLTTHQAPKIERQLLPVSLNVVEQWARYTSMGELHGFSPRQETSPITLDARFGQTPAGLGPSRNHQTFVIFSGADQQGSTISAFPRIGL